MAPSVTNAELASKLSARARVSGPSNLSFPALTMAAGLAECVAPGAGRRQTQREAALAASSHQGTAARLGAGATVMGVEAFHPSKLLLPLRPCTRHMWAVRKSFSWMCGVRPVPTSAFSKSWPYLFHAVRCG
jgi:hypothetical protein